MKTRNENQNKYIDTHVHLWHYTQSEFPWISETMHSLTIDRLFGDIKKAIKHEKVSQVVLVQSRQMKADTSFLCNIAKEHDEILGVVGWTNLFSENREEELEQFQVVKSEYKLKGFRHFIQKESHPNFMMQMHFIGAMKLLKKYGFLYEVIVKPTQFDQFINLLETQKEESLPLFVLDHLGKPKIGGSDEDFALWKEKFTQVAHYPNVVCKISGLLTEVVADAQRPVDYRKYIDVAVEAFGPSRLMLGSDWPICTIEGTYTESFGVASYLEQQLGADAWEQVSNGTARRVYDK